MTPRAHTVQTKYVRSTECQPPRSGSVACRRLEAARGFVTTEVRFLSDRELSKKLQANSLPGEVTQLHLDRATVAHGTPQSVVASRRHTKHDAGQAIESDQERPPDPGAGPLM